MAIMRFQEFLLETTDISKFLGYLLAKKKKKLCEQQQKNLFLLTNRGECGVSPRPASRAVSSATCGSKPLPLPDNCLQPVMSAAAPCQKCTTFYILFIFPLSLPNTPSITSLFFHFVCSSIYHQTFEDVGYRRREGGKSQPGLEDEAQNYGSFHFTSDSHTCNILLLIL